MANNPSILVNKAGKGRYTNQDAIDKLIKYLTRTNGQSDSDLVSWGVLGAPEFYGVDTIIDEFQLTQTYHKRKGNFGRYIDHEIFTFLPETEKVIYENNLDIDKIARDMAYDFLDNDHCQVVYSVHCNPKDDIPLHIHFAINTVNFIDAHKRRESKADNRKRTQRFQKIVEDNIRNEHISLR